MGDGKRLDDELAGIEPSRRTFIKRIAVGAAFATPIVSSFSMSGLSVTSNVAQAASSLRDGAGAAAN